MTLILASLVLAACSKDSGPSDRPRSIALEQDLPCDQFLETLPADFKHGWVTTNEIPGDPTSPKLQIFYYYRAPLNERPALFINGGPGSSSHPSWKMMESALKEFKADDKVTFIYFDQRGTGCSTGYPQTKTGAEAFERGKWYGSRGIVGDAETLRLNLIGDHPWSIFTQSYGAFVAHRYAIVAPQSLNRVIAYANAITPDGEARMENRLRSQLTAWEGYFTKYPGDRENVNLLIANLKTTDCAIFGQSKICGYALLSPIVPSYLGWTDAWPDLHEWLTAFTAGNVVHFDQVQDFKKRFYSPGIQSRELALSAINDWDRNVGLFDSPSCQRIRSDLERAEPNLNFAASLTECSNALQFTFTDKIGTEAEAYFEGQRDSITIADFKAALAGRPANFFFLYSGELDPYVPPAQFKEELDAHPSLTYRMFKETAHEGFYTQRQVFDDLTAP